MSTPSLNINRTDLLFKKHHPWLRKIAKRYYWRHGGSSSAFTYEDFEQAAYVGFSLAASRYEGPLHDETEFQKFSYKSVVGQIYDFLQEQYMTSRKTREYASVSTGVPSAVLNRIDSAAYSIESGVIKRELSHTVADAFKNLNSKELSLIVSKYVRGISLTAQASDRPSMTIDVARTRLQKAHAKIKRYLLARYSLSELQEAFHRSDRATR